MVRLLTGTEARRVTLTATGHNQHRDGEALQALQRTIRACRACVDAGYIPSAHPILRGNAMARLMVVGQAIWISSRATDPKPDAGGGSGN